MTRRNFLRSGAALGSGVLTAPMVNRDRCRLFAGSRIEYSRRAIDLVESSLVIDMLGLLTLQWDQLDNWQRRPGAFGASEFAKIRTSSISVFHPAVNLCEPDVYGASRVWLEGWREFVGRYPDYFVRVESAADIALSKRAGKIGIVLGLQDSAHFRSAADVAEFHALGQRISQVTYNSRNLLGSGCVEHPDSGLTEFGARIVGAMNRCGMAIDVSHAGERTTLETIGASTRPVLITHSNCRALSPHPRCKSDAAIRAMARTGGVIGLTGLRPFVARGGRATLEQVLDHFDHVARLVGVDHIGVGSDTDLDGRANHLDVGGLNHPRRIYDLTEGLIRRRYTPAHIRMILGGNFQRVLGQVWG